MNEKNLVVMGYVQKALGIQGWVAIRPDTEMFDSLLHYPILYLGVLGGLWQPYEQVTSQVRPFALAVAFKSVTNRDQALALKGRLVAVPRNQLPKPQPHEYYWTDLIGMTVSNHGGKTLGQVTQLFRTAAHDVMVVKNDTKEQSIPFVLAIIKDVNLSNRSIKVVWEADD